MKEGKIYLMRQKNLERARQSLVEIRHIIGIRKG